VIVQETPVVPARAFWATQPLFQAGDCPNAGMAQSRIKNGRKRLMG
jgi:hypothetical protein